MSREYHLVLITVTDNNQLKERFDFVFTITPFFEFKRYEMRDPATGRLLSKEGSGRVLGIDEIEQLLFLKNFLVGDADNPVDDDEVFWSIYPQFAKRDRDELRKFRMLNKL